MGEEDLGVLACAEEVCVFGEREVACDEELELQREEEEFRKIAGSSGEGFGS